MMRENTPTIETNRIILRKFTENDSTDMLSLYSDDKVNKFLPWFPIKTLEDVEKYLHNSILPCYKKDISYSYAITMKSDNRVIGYIHIHDIGGSNDIGYGLRKEFWHMGITTEACVAVVKRLQKANFTFITATHDINNPYSGEVMKKIGMTYRYSYEEKWQPKDSIVTFRMYQLNFSGSDKYTYMKYWNINKNHWVETGLDKHTVGV